MGRIRPIPRNALPHRALLFPCAGRDRWGDGREGPEVRLEQIRITGRLAGDRGAWREGWREELTLFFDMTNSRPTGAGFTLGDRVVFEGTGYRVAGIRPVVSDARSLPVHHYEIRLIQDVKGGGHSGS